MKRPDATEFYLSLPSAEFHTLRLETRPPTPRLFPSEAAEGGSRTRVAGGLAGRPSSVAARIIGRLFAGRIVRSPRRGLLRRTQLKPICLITFDEFQRNVGKNG